MTYRNKSESEKGIRLSGEACIVCGWIKKDLLGNSLVEGAHVKPLENDAKCDCYNNIIALCPNHHTMFDRYMFYIDSESLHIIFDDKSDEYNGVDVSPKIKHIKKEYLAYRQYLYTNNHSIKV